MTSLPDPHALLAHLGIRDPRAIDRIPGGFGDNAIWRVETGGPDAQTVGLRLFGPRDERVFRREGAAMRAARSGGVPVPRVLAAETIDGRPVMLMEWASGRTMSEELLTRPRRAWALGTLLGNVHAWLHTCDPAPDLQEHGVDWISWMGTNEPALKERLLLVGERSTLPRTIIHLDFHPMNVLVHSGKVTGVIDWANAGVGDLRADVARTASILRFSPLPPGPVGEQIHRLRRLFCRAWRLAHRRTHGHLPDMELFDAWALAAMGLSDAYFESLRRALENRKRRLGLD